jgi:hypothetical protein
MIWAVASATYRLDLAIGVGDAAGGLLSLAPPPGGGLRSGYRP